MRSDLQWWVRVETDLVSSLEIIDVRQEPPTELADRYVEISEAERRTLLLLQAKRDNVNEQMGRYTPQGRADE